MSIDQPPIPDTSETFADELAELVRQLAHVLPSQAPIRDFVHHNTLHGYQHLPFEQALSEARKDLGVSGFWPLSRFREEYTKGRITAKDLDAVLDDAHPAMDVEIVPGVSRRMIWRSVLRFDCAPCSASRLRWLQTMAAPDDLLQKIPPEIAAESRRWKDGATAQELARLWTEVTGQTNALLSDVHSPAHRQAPRSWIELMDELGMSADSSVSGRGTLRDLVWRLTGDDVLDAIGPEFIRQCAAHLDQGLAAWRNPLSGGFYDTWRQSTMRDPGWTTGWTTGWTMGSTAGSHGEARKRLAALPADPVAAIETELQRIALPRTVWMTYLQRLALQLRGWSGMFLWRETHPEYAGLTTPVALIDYLAVYLVLENMAVDAVAHRVWGVAANLTSLASYFWLHPVELQLRLACHRGELPEALASQIQQMEAPGERAAESRAAWDALALEAGRLAEQNSQDDVQRLCEYAWPLYCIALCTGLDDQAVRALGAKSGDGGLVKLLNCANELDDDRKGYLWLQAYERHYAEQIFSALHANHGRVRSTRLASENAVEAQLVLCMDEREEGFRRHLEEVNPRLETLGAAAHFGVFQNWRGLGDETVTPLCPVVPVVIKPSHEVREVPRDGEQAVAAKWLRINSARRQARGRWLQRTRFGLLSALVGSFVQAPLSVAQLLIRSLHPRLLPQDRAGMSRPATQLDLTATPDQAEQPATPESPRLGFTDDEQAERVGNFLSSMGLVKNFAPLVVIMGHGSDSQNNPHLAAYDCGACAGRHSGPNARLFAAMINRPVVRALLGLRGIHVPASTHFIGAEHNTCDDTVAWYDLDDIPSSLAEASRKLLSEIRHAGELHAVERCRRLMSAPLDGSPTLASRHVAKRRADYAQPRPELGHVTNACAFIGRRPLSRGVFFDRRAFLISYDPTHDADAAVLTRHLCINGPVGAGINLEYYFSTVSNQCFGSGTKTMHNITGGLGVMSGTRSDLRTGLPWQMVEIHEPMRLLVVVEQTTEMLTRIYQTQPAVQDMVGKGWLLLAAIEPMETSRGEAIIHRFDPQRGWLRWTPTEDGAKNSLPEVERSADWFGGHRHSLPPALLRRPLAGMPRDTEQQESATS